MKRFLIIPIILLLAFPLYAMQPALLGCAGAGGAAAETIGNDDVTVGDSSAAFGANVIACSALDTPAQSGTIDQFSVLSANTSETLDIEVGLYTNAAGTPGNVVGTETRILNPGSWTAGWKDFTVSYAVTAGTYYWLCYRINEASVFTLYYKSGAANSRYTSAYDWSNAWPSPSYSPSGGTPRYGIKARVTH